MKIQFLGTAAAEAIPALFCTCETCTKARKTKGKNIRSRTQALVDGKLLIDFPPDTFMHCMNYNVDLADIEHCLITHTHSDHLYINDMYMRAPGYSNLPNEKIFNLYGHPGTMEKIGGDISENKPALLPFMKTNALELYEKTKVGEHTVTALEAVHEESTFPYIYLIENIEGKALLYGHDTNYFSEPVWEYIEKNKIKLSFVSLDCCAACNTRRLRSHMNLDDNIRTKERLIEIGCADESTLFCCNHFSHNAAKVLYEEFEPEAAKFGFITSYDGMVAQF